MTIVTMCVCLYFHNVLKGQTTTKLFKEHIFFIQSDLPHSYI